MRRIDLTSGAVYSSEVKLKKYWIALRVVFKI